MVDGWFLDIPTKALEKVTQEGYLSNALSNESP